MATAQDVLDLARSQLGTSSPDNTTPYNLEYGLSGPGAAWCQMFVWWCLSHSGVDTIRTAWTPSGIAYYEENGRWTQGGCLDGAQPGDVIYFDYDNYQGQRTDHVGLIEAVGDLYVQTIEGNVGGGQVKRLWHKICAGYIVGYGRPLYDGQPAGNTYIAPAQPDSSSDVVRQRQAWLNKIGINAGPEDGVLGPKTKAAIQEYQRRLGCDPDGDWGPVTQRLHDQFITWLASNNAPSPGPTPPEPTVDLSGLAASLNAAKQQIVRQGNKGDAVKWVQALCNHAGANIAVDGDFGPQTDQAVRDFQGSHGCTVDGIVGPQTWAALTA